VYNKSIFIEGALLMNFNLLFVLPDRKNQNILSIKSEGNYRFPVYEKLIEDKIGSAIP